MDNFTFLHEKDMSIFSKTWFDLSNLMLLNAF